MFHRVALCMVALGFTLISGVPARAESTCADPAKALGVDRVVEIDAANGPLYGDISVLQREENFLRPREVVLTFDDGPMPWITRSILDTLDRFCTKATFFSVGRMAIAYPDTVKDVLARGHTLGGHTWSHPLNLKRRGLTKAIDEIERGFAAIALAAGQPIAPFFRFPGLSDSDPMMAHLQQRGIAAFTVDVISNDSYIGSADRLASYTLAQVDQKKGGIILFHDIKSATKVRPGPAAKPELVAANTAPEAGTGAQAHLMPFFGSAEVLKTLSGADAEVTSLSPAARTRAMAVSSGEHSESDTAKTGERRKPKSVRSKRASTSSAEPAPFSFFSF
ncbi:MAG: polysaccharide deacetylase family protein [Hyphomicrobium sp.]|nr:polysaccharide deacetylase family protein [Hyphomicrobium sp.]